MIWSIDDHARATRRNVRGSHVALLLSLAGLAILFGCAVPGALYYKVVGPPAVPARFTPKPDQPLVVVVDTSHSTAAYVPEAEELLQALNDDLTEHKVAPMVELRKVHELRDSAGGAFDRMGIAEIGRKVGARQVIYVDLTQCDLTSDPGTDVFTLKLRAIVRVVDAQTRTTLWPDGDTGEPYEYTSHPTRATAEMNESTIKREALRETGGDIARMFYAWKPDTMGEENRDMRLR